MNKVLFKVLITPEGQFKVSQQIEPSHHIFKDNIETFDEARAIAISQTKLAMSGPIKFEQFYQLSSSGLRFEPSESARMLEALMIKDGLNIYRGEAERLKWINPATKVKVTVFQKVEGSIPYQYRQGGNFYYRGFIFKITEHQTDKNVPKCVMIRLVKGEYYAG